MVKLFPKREVVQIPALELAYGGGGIHAARAYAEVQALAELLNMPVATSINGKGSIAETHPLALGVVGANGGRAFAHDFIRESDLILFAGTRVNYVTSNDWTVPPKDYAGAIIQIDVDGGEIGNNLPVTAGLQGDAQLALRDLVEALHGFVASGELTDDPAGNRSSKHWNAVGKRSVYAP